MGSLSLFFGHLERTKSEAKIIVKFVKRIFHLDKAFLDLDGGLKGLSLLLGAGNGLGAEDTTTPVAARLLVLVGVALLDGGEELGELSLVLGAGLSQGEDSSGLVNYISSPYIIGELLDRNIPSCGQRYRDEPCP